MLRRRAHVALIATLLLAGCGSSSPEPLPLACLGDATSFAEALDGAPGSVTLEDGTPLSRCVSLASRHDGELQTLGVTLTRVGDRLRARAGGDAGAALRLGYLVGAVRRGAADTPGIAAQLARRVEQTAGPQIAAAAPRAALRRGIGLGEAGG